MRRAAVVAIRRAVGIRISVRVAAAAQAGEELICIVGASVIAIGRAVAVGIIFRRAASALTRFSLVRIVRTIIDGARTQVIAVSKMGGQR